MAETNEQYHADTKWVSKSMLAVFAHSRREYFERFVEKSRPAEPATDAMQKGTIAHLAILEPERFAESVAVAPTWTRDNRKAFESWSEETKATGKYEHILTVDQSREMDKMRGAAMSVARPLLDSPGLVEHSLRWLDRESGLGLKCRVDKLIVAATPLILDLKTTYDTSARQFYFTAKKFDYGLQQIHYSDGVRWECGVVPSFYFLVVGTTKPFDAKMYSLPEKSLNDAKMRWRFLLNELAECYASGKWDEAGSVPVEPAEAAGW